jgi:hypothetical protein
MFTLFWLSGLEGVWMMWPLVAAGPSVMRGTGALIVWPITLVPRRLWS